MEYLEFERILSAKRMQRYKDAANGDTRKAMALYRHNLRLSQEMFTIVSCFEVAGIYLAAQCFVQISVHV